MTPDHEPELGDETDDTENDWCDGCNRPAVACVCDERDDEEE